MGAIVNCDCEDCQQRVPAEEVVQSPGNKFYCRTCRKLQETKDGMSDQDLLTHFPEIQHAELFGPLRERVAMLLVDAQPDPPAEGESASSFDEINRLFASRLVQCLQACAGVSANVVQPSVLKGYMLGIIKPLIGSQDVVIEAQQGAAIVLRDAGVHVEDAVASEGSDGIPT